MDILTVECRHFKTALNCSSRSLSKDIKDACCTRGPSMESSRQLYINTLMKCCEVLEDYGYGGSDNNDWENGSYQAYVMGVAVFAILICLFVSGARSIRRRRMLLRARLHQQVGGAGSDNLPQINTQISLGPPTYGELEASGLTKDYKMGLFDPPAYPGTPESCRDNVMTPADQGIETTALENREAKSPETETPSSRDETDKHKGGQSTCIEVEFRSSGSLG